MKGISAVWDELWRAMALVLVIEGLMPFVAPARWRRMLQVVERMDDAALRRIGLVSMLTGAAALYFIGRGTSL